MTIAELRDLLADVDWTEVHHMRTQSFGRRVELWLEKQDDGTEYLLPVIMEQNTWQPGAVVVGSLPCWGGNLDSSDYAEGWATKNIDGTYTVDETGEIVPEDEMVSKCIEEGDWQEEYDSWTEELVEQYATKQAYEQFREE